MADTDGTLDEHLDLAIRTRVLVETGVQLNEDQRAAFVALIRSVVAAQGLVVVPAEDIRKHLSIDLQGSDEWGAARRRLRAALPATEETREGEQR